MAQGEFSVIEKYFFSQAQQRKSKNISLGIGDDAAVLNVPTGHQLVATMDTLVAGRHFPLETNPFDIAFKSLAVNVSDLVAMAATPAYFLLSLTLPEADRNFLNKFSQGLFDAADKFGISLVGGDTCKGPLSITIQANGFISENKFVSRSGACVGDKIVVSGELGAAALGLACIQNRIKLSASHEKYCKKALNKPEPRLDLIKLLATYANSAIDLSDGLAGDLAHILKSSAVGAVINRPKIPAYSGLNEHGLLDYALTGGDDYQILFTVAEKSMDGLLNSAAEQGLELFVIGDIVENGYVLMDQNSSADLTTLKGFDHFVS